MIKAIVFDNGGVVLNDIRKPYYLFFAKRLGINPKRAEDVFKPYEYRLDRGLITEKEFWKRVFIDLKKEFDRSFIGLLTFTLEKYIKINRPVLKLADKLKKNGYLVPMLSNTIEQHTIAPVEKRVHKHFNPKILSNRVGMRKPNKNIYAYMLKKIRLKAKECVFIDNQIENIVTARRMGFNSIHFKNYSQLRRELKKLGVEL